MPDTTFGELFEIKCLGMHPLVCGHGDWDAFGLLIYLFLEHFVVFGRRLFSWSLCFVSSAHTYVPRRVKTRNLFLQFKWRNLHSVVSTSVGDPSDGHTSEDRTREAFSQSNVCPRTPLEHSYPSPHLPVGRLCRAFEGVWGGTWYASYLRGS